MVHLPVVHGNGTSSADRRFPSPDARVPHDGPADAEPRRPTSRPPGLRPAAAAERTPAVSQWGLPAHPASLFAQAANTPAGEGTSTPAGEAMARWGNRPVRPEPVAGFVVGTAIDSRFTESTIA
ncbi:hypothetical protein [Streptomyces sp. NPDC054783]